MADISIIEFIVYGIIAYSSMLMLIISTIKEIPESRSGAIARSIFLMPGAICAMILGTSGEGIITSSTTNTIVDLNTTSVWTEAVNSQIELQAPVWVTVHFLIFIVILFYVVWQIMNLLTKKD